MKIMSLTIGLLWFKSLKTYRKEPITKTNGLTKVFRSEITTIVPKWYFSVSLMDLLMGSYSLSNLLWSL